MSFLTCFWLFPQKEHFSRSPPSPMRATGGSSGSAGGGGACRQSYVRAWRAVRHGRPAGGANPLTDRPDGDGHEELVAVTP